jgi:glucokinase
MHCIDPDMIVFTGGMIGAGESFLDRIRWHVQRLAFPVPAAKTQIRYAQLGTDAGFIGAAACGRKLYQTHHKGTKNTKKATEKKNRMKKAR